MHLECVFLCVCTSPITCWLVSRAFRPEPARWQGSGLAGRFWTLPRHRCIRCIMTSFATTGGSHENATQHQIFTCKYFVWNDENSQNQTFTIFYETISIMYVKLFTTRKTCTFAIYLCNIYNVSSLSEPTVFLHAGDICCTCRAWETNGANTNTKSLLFQQSLWLHQNAWFNFEQIMLRYTTKCVFIVCKVTSMSAISYNNRNPALGILWSWQDHRTPSAGLQLL